MTTAELPVREFAPWPKIPRFNRRIIVTEKIDGTNGCIVVTEDDIYCQSRKRILSLKEDNHGFAHWVNSNKDELREQLGIGRHYGEWWGGDIGERYRGVVKEKRFSLFDVDRWTSDVFRAYECYEAPLCKVVPIVSESETFDSTLVRSAVELLRQNGSMAAAPGGQAEGVVVYHPHANQMFKVSLVNDDYHKKQAKDV